MTVDHAVKGLAVLTAIPVVGFAIWADYFGRSIDRLAADDPLYERAEEKAKIRLASLVTLLLQFSIFVATYEIRQVSPLWAYGLFMAAFVIQGRVQAGAESKLKGPHDESVKLAVGNAVAEPASELRTAMNGFLWATIGGTLYIVMFAIPVVAASLIARFGHLGENATAALVVGSAVVGMLSGLAVNFALAPFYLQRMLRSEKVEDPRLNAALSDCFARGGLALPSFYVIRARSHEATAMVAGFPFGRGVFRPGLFISQGMLDALNEEELRAVVLHEVAHLKLRHLMRRLGYSATLIFGTTAVATFCVYAASVVAPAGELKNMVGFAAAAGAFLATFKLLGRQSRNQEFVADHHAVSALGASSESLVSALRKLDRVNHLDPMNRVAQLSGSHPATDARVARLEAQFGAATAASDEQDRKAA